LNALSWSADGKSIAAIAGNDQDSRRQIMLADVATGKETVLLMPEWRTVGPAAWLPDGMSILVNAQEHSGETSTQILACRASVISPGRKRLAIVRGRVTSDVVLVSTLAEAEEWAEA